MCGIVGFVYADGQPVSPSILKSATETLAHRGPDGDGYWIEGNVGLGHRRLSILDLSSAGQQPMLSHNQRYVITYNGEVYNFREIRAELRTKGVHCISETDSEVVLNAFSFWGVEALLKFNGMFSFAIYDREKRKLFLCRDRYGIKPLYYSIQDNVIAFASEQRAIIQNKNFTKTLNKRALLEYFTFQNILTDQTLINDIRLVPAGHYLEIDIKSQNVMKHEYWDYRFQDEGKKIDVRECEEELDRLFIQAVNRQLVSDVELGAYLSGGMDSGSITAIASQNIGNLKTFTCGFELTSASGLELGYDEREKAEAMSALFKTEHYEFILKSGDMERSLKKVAYHLEEPRVGQSYPNYFAAGLASKFVKVVLSGAGGDELFGGYPWRYYRGANALNFEDFVDKYYIFWQRLASNSELKRLFAPIWADVSDVWTRDIFRDVFLTHDIELKKPEDYINHSLYFEAKTFLHGLFLVEDKLSMAHSLETRVPFMDNDLVDFAMKCPVNFKINNLLKVTTFDQNTSGNERIKHFEKTSDGKTILRNMMSKYIPQKITKAPKQGFSSPDASWFKGESIDFVVKKLLSDHSPLNEYFDPSVINELVGQHLDGSRNRRLLIWSLLNFNQLLEDQF